MLKQLKYIEGSSNKFWNIETQDNSFTVTYGRVGTAGVSKTKQFEDEARCLKEAEKLIAEKIKKGYSESGEVILAEPSAPAKNTKSESISKQQVLALYDQILETNNIDGLLDFLQQHSKGHITELKKHLKKAKKYWLEYVKLEVQSTKKSFVSLFDPQVNEKWGTRGNKTTEQILCLTALALLNEVEARSWEEHLINCLKEVNNPYLLAILQWSKPDWISAYLLERRKKVPWNTLSYRQLRSLEDKGLIHYQPELFALTIASFNPYYNAADEYITYTKWLLTDQYALKRDVPLLFVYETTMPASCYQPEQKDDEANYFSFWQYVFDCIFERQLVERKLFLEQALLTQTKNWNTALKSFIRQQIKRLNITVEETLSLQDTFFGLLCSDQRAVVNFVIELLKPALWEKSFKLDIFLDELPAVMMRDDCKGSVKTLLIELDKLAKKDKTKQQALCLLAADVFVIPQLAVQERAAKFIINYGSPTDNELVEKIQLYQDQLLGTLKTELAAYLATSPNEECNVLAAFDEPCNYLYQAPCIQHLLPENQINLPSSWDEVLYSFGRFIQSTDPIDSELLMYALVCCRHLFPEDADEQLKPYIKQLKNIQGELYFRHVLGVCFAFILENTPKEFDTIYQTESANIPICQMKLVYNCISNGYKLPLLSLPTHQPYWVAPKVLVERLIAYEQNKQPIDWLDLSIALSRMPRENIEEALVLTEQLSSELALLIRFCLADQTIIEQRQQSGFLKQLFKTEEVSLIDGVWATAARTFYPEQIFDVFDKSTLLALPFAKEPWQPELTLRRIAYQQSVISFLYTAGYSKQFYDKNAYYDLSFLGDVRYYCSLMPQYQESIAMLALKYCGKSADANGSSIKEFLEACLDASFMYRNNALWVLVCGLLKKKKETRLLAIEVLIKSIEEQRLPLEDSAKRLITLIQSGYAPLGRLIEALAALKDVSALHNDALLQWLEIMFELIAKKQQLPNHFKKMLEIYFDLLVRLQRAPAHGLTPALTQWQEQKSLASLLKQINRLKAG